MLQSNRNLPFGYANKLREIVEKTVSNLAEIFPNYGLVINSQLVRENPHGKYLVLSFLPEEKNLLRNIPFISLSAAIIHSKDLTKELEKILSAVIIDPLNDKFYWMDEDKNNSFEKNYNLRLAQVSDISRSYGVNVEAGSANFNSVNLELMMLASGRLDFVKAKFENYLDIIAALAILGKTNAKIEIDFKNKIIKAANEAIFENVK